METRITRYGQGALLLLYLGLGLFLTFQINKVNNQYTTEYFIVLLSYFLMVGMWIVYISRYGFYIFEPITMVAGLSIMTFSIEPLISMITADTLLAGFDVYEGCIKATIIYMFALTAYFFVYYNRFSLGKKEYYVEGDDDWDGEYSNSSLLLMLAYAFTIIGVAVSVVDLLKQGFSLQYILSLGSEGSFDAMEDSIGVFINLRYMMLPGFLYLDLYSKNRLANNLLRAVAIACMFMRNKRWIIILIVLSPIVLYYIRNKRKPSLKLIASTVGVLAVLVGAMQYMRGISTSITEVDWSSFDFLSIWKGFSGNLDLYKTLYAAVDYFPNSHPYTLGQQLVFLTLVTCIPRAIWPNKPVSIIDSKLKPLFMGNGAVRGAWAYAQLTEYYIEFGIIGTIICMCMFAAFCKYLKDCTFAPRNIHDLVLASTLFPMLMQLVIRGYMPINFWAMFFMVIPITVMKRAERMR